jgi:hypothetical protein
MQFDFTHLHRLHVDERIGDRVPAHVDLRYIIRSWPKILGVGRTEVRGISSKRSHRPRIRVRIAVELLRALLDAAQGLR